MFLGAGHLHRVYICHSMRDDEPEIFNMGLLKLTLLRLEEQVVLTEMV